MTADRKKAAFFLTLTLIVGILIGMMIPGLLFRMHRGGPPKGQKEMRGGGRMGRPEGPGRQDTVRREWLTHVIIRVIKPDSAQMKEIRPLTTATAAQVKALEGESNERMGVIMDSLKIKLRPILTEEQNQKLDNFSSKARRGWRR